MKNDEKAPKKDRSMLICTLLAVVLAGIVGCETGKNIAASMHAEDTQAPTQVARDTEKSTVGQSSEEEWPTVLMTTDEVITGLQAGAITYTDVFRKQEAVTTEKMTSGRMKDCWFTVDAVTEYFRPRRFTNMVFVSPFYDPLRYEVNIELDTGEVIHAHLCNLRLVTDGSEDVMRYLALGEDEYYIEFNCSPDDFARIVPDEFFEGYDEHQIAFLRQYLSDTAMQLKGGE